MDVSWSRAGIAALTFGALAGVTITAGGAGREVLGVDCARGEANAFRARSALSETVSAPE